MLCKLSPEDESGAKEEAAERKVVECNAKADTYILVRQVATLGLEDRWLGNSLPKAQESSNEVLLL